MIVFFSAQEEAVVFSQCYFHFQDIPPLTDWMEAIVVTMVSESESL
jgi:hypothetical protein